MECWGRISRTVVKPTCMGKPVASSNREIVDSIRGVIAFGMNNDMRFQKGGGREGSATPWMKANEGWSWIRNPLIGMVGDLGIS